MNENATESHEDITCPQCGAMVLSGASRCWRCKASQFEISEPVTSTNAVPTSPQSPTRALRATQFRLSTLMLTVTVAAVILGMARLHPTLGLLAVLVVVPAVIRSVWAARLRQNEGSPMTIKEKASTFMGSFLLMFFIWYTVVLVSVIASTVGSLGAIFVSEAFRSQGYAPLDWSVYFGLACGILFGGGLAVFFFRYLWKLRLFFSFLLLSYIGF